jgi:lipoate-protein ligase B
MQVIRLFKPRPYATALETQRQLHRRRCAGEVPDILLLLEHQPVVTIGRNGKSSNLVAPESFLKSKGIDLVWTDRGGDITYHGPGQLVGYLIVDLKGLHHDVHRFVREIEEGIIRAARWWGIEAQRNPGKTGVWVGGRKLASIGLKASHWVSMHGFALNISTDLRAFDLIVPCGIPDCRMVSIRELVGHPIDLTLVGRAVAGELGRIWNRRPEMEECYGWPI